MSKRIYKLANGYVLFVHGKGTERKLMVTASQESEPIPVYEEVVFEMILDMVDRLQKELEEAKAENEAIHKDKVELWYCPSCNFAMDAVQENVDLATGKGNGNYTCPLCELDEKDSELEEARQTIARYREAQENKGI